MPSSYILASCKLFQARLGTSSRALHISIFKACYFPLVQSYPNRLSERARLEKRFDSWISARGNNNFFFNRRFPPPFCCLRSLSGFVSQPFFLRFHCLLRYNALSSAKTLVDLFANSKWAIVLLSTIPICSLTLESLSNLIPFP